MKVFVDENMNSQRLAARLRAAGHDVALVEDFGLFSATDARVMRCAVAEARPVLTRNYGDFTDLHDLILTVGGHHPGILMVRFDNDPRRNLTERGIASALTKLETSGVSITDQIHVLNQWR